MTTYRRYAKDGTCNTTPTASTGDWVVTVTPLPQLTCPGDLMVGTSDGGSGDCDGVATWVHPMETAGACQPIQLSMQINTGAPVVVNPGATFNQSLPVGVHQVSYQVSDGLMNTASCSLTVTVNDDDLPQLNCVSTYSARLDGQSAINLNLADLGVVTDNCGSVQTTIMPSELTIAQVGQIIPVRVIAQDAAMNMAECTVMVSLASLPPGWRHESGSVGNCDSEMEYDFDTGVWTASATNCANGSPFQQDALMFAQRRLCGDGSITAHVAGLVGGAGFAGVTMRESTMTGPGKCS